MHFVEPNQRLPLAVRTILARVNFDDFICFVFSRLLQGVLNVVPGKNMMAIVGQDNGGANPQSRQPNP